MEKYQTKVVNFFAGPGAAKSIMAADVYAKIRWAGINAEIALEYAKDMVYEKAIGKLQNQVYITGQQLQKLVRLDGQVEIIVCDSPLLLSTFYDKDKNKALRDLCVDQFQRFNNINYFINRNDKLFEQSGRIHNLEESKKKDKQIKSFLDLYEIEYKDINAGPESCDDIAQDIINLITKERTTYDKI